MGELFWESGVGPQSPEANGGLGAKPPAAGGLASGSVASGAQNFCIFLQNELNFRAILIENNAFRTWHKNWQPNMIQLCALMGYMRCG